MLPTLLCGVGGTPGRLAQETFLTGTSWPSLSLLSPYRARKAAGGPHPLWGPEAEAQAHVSPSSCPSVPQAIAHGGCSSLSPLSASPNFSPLILPYRALASLGSRCTYPVSIDFPNLRNPGHKATWCPHEHHCLPEAWLPFKDREDLLTLRVLPGGRAWPWLQGIWRSYFSKELSLL